MFQETRCYSIVPDVQSASCMLEYPGSSYPRLCLKCRVKPPVGPPCEGNCVCNNIKTWNDVTNCNKAEFSLEVLSGDDRCPGCSCTEITTWEDACRCSRKNSTGTYFLFTGS